MNAKILGMAVMILILVPLALADGIPIYFHHHEYRPPNIVNEARQIAFIDWKDGMEQMLIKTELKTAEAGEGTYVWIFPVPAEPADTVVHHIKRVEYYRTGENIYKATEDAIKSKASTIFAITQVWPLIPAAFSGKQGHTAAVIGTIGSVRSRIGSSAENYGVTVHETIQKYGLTSQVITAKDANGLRRYIQDKFHVNLPDDAEHVLSDYIGKNFTFVVSEANGTPEAMAVLVEFPTDRPYFPLKPTSVYGSKIVPITVYIDGFWQPNVWHEIKPRIGVEHRINGSAPKIEGDVKLFGKFKDFTIVSMDVPSKYLKEDFYFKKDTVAGLTNHIREHATVYAFLLLLAVFSLSGLLAWLVLSRKKEHLSTYVIAGAASVLTPAGTAIALARRKTSARYTLPSFKKWWQNIIYYTLAIYIILVALIVIGAIWYVISEALLSTYPSMSDMKDFFLSTAILLAAIGGGAILFALGAVPMYFMHKKWVHGDSGVPVVPLVTILVFNAVLYAITMGWVLV